MSQDYYHLVMGNNRKWIFTFMFDRLFASKQRPYFKKSSRWDTLSLDLSGTRFEITLPPQDYDFPEGPFTPKVNVFDKNIYRYRTESRRSEVPPGQNGTTVPSILTRNWFSYGPIWRARHIGTLQCTVVISDISQMPTSFDCFNPQQFEKLILHTLYHSQGPGFGTNENTCPVNWSIRNIQGADWVYLESWSRKPAWKEDTSQYRDANFSVWLFAPIFKDKYLLVTFSGTGSLPADASNQAMFTRIEEIMPSILLQLSPEALKQKAEAEKLNPSSSYSKNREPEPWQYYTSYRDGDILKGESDLVIEGPCSPPPPLS